MSQPKVISIDGVDYVRQDQISQDIGEMRIIVADKGWVFVGNCTDNDDGSVTIRNAKNIRRWGTTKGLGELSSGPTDSTTFDEYGTVKTVPVVTIAVDGGW